jgi:replication factor C small subunit
METIKIKSIRKIEKGKVRNLKVHKNHTFLTSNGIGTQNCDGATDEFFKGLRAVMERYASTARFIASCNYIQKIPEPIQSRFHIISFDPLNKKEEEFLIEEYKKRVKLILDAIKITYTEEALHKFIINDFPDLRALTNKIQSFYDSKITELNPDNFNINYDFKDLFDICLSKPDPITNYKFIGSEYSSRIDDALTALGKDFPEYLKNNSNKIDKLPLIIIAIAEYQYQKSFVIDPIITLLACVFKIQTILN